MPGLLLGHGTRGYKGTWNQCSGAACLAWPGLSPSLARPLWERDCTPFSSVGVWVGGVTLPLLLQAERASGSRGRQGESSGLITGDFSMLI